MKHPIGSCPFRSKLIEPPVPEIQLSKNMTLKIQGQGHGWGQYSKSQWEPNILSTHIPFVPCQLALLFLRYIIPKSSPWNSRVKFKWPWCCINLGSRQFHRTSNDINPSGSFRDMCFAKSDPSAAWVDKFLAHGQDHMKRMGKQLWRCTTTGLDMSTTLWIG